MCLGVDVFEFILIGDGLISLKVEPNIFQIKFWRISAIISLIIIG